MTHTLHRRGSEKSLGKDYVLLCMAAKGINEKGSEEKMREFLRINLRHHPVNIGDMRTGNMYNVPVDEILKKVTSTSIVHGVFTDRATVMNVLKDLKKADLGMSVVVSGPFGCVGEICRAAGLRPHSADYSGDIWGKRDKLPPNEMLELTTMCGHAMVASNLVTSLIEEIKAGERSPEDAGKELAKVCECGIFNPVRAAELLRGLASK
ncbi:MAG: hypothetical protein ABSE95_15700 [Thermodesulfobacteriota bacterium]